MELRYSVSVEREIRARPEKIFQYLADPSLHSSFDGSGMVRRPRGGETGKLYKGAVFEMGMRAMGFFPYVMVNEVVEFEENKRIAWQPRMKGPLGRVVGGRIWRYELEDRGETTLVRETWDISQDRLKGLLANKRVRAMVENAMAESLKRLAALVEGGSETR
jgi:uncharacterized protein YndB with AHSA1/START domain